MIYPCFYPYLRSQLCRACSEPLKGLSAAVGVESGTLSGGRAAVRRTYLLGALQLLPGTLLLILPPTHSSATATTPVA